MTGASVRARVWKLAAAGCLCSTGGGFCWMLWFHSMPRRVFFNPVQCGEFSHGLVFVFVLILKRGMMGMWLMRFCWEGSWMSREEGTSWCRSVNPGHRNPLAGGAHQIHGLFQVPDGLVDLVVDDGLVEVVGVGLLQDLRLLLEPLERVVLEEEEELKRALRHGWRRRDENSYRTDTLDF